MQGSGVIFKVFVLLKYLYCGHEPVILLIISRCSCKLCKPIHEPFVVPTLLKNGNTPAPAYD
jgi:hypothetical protein